MPISWQPSPCKAYSPPWTAAMSVLDALAWLRGLVPVLSHSRAGLGRDRTHPAADRAMLPLGAATDRLVTAAAGRRS